jgi:hypothetical protein
MAGQSVVIVGTMTDADGTTKQVTIQGVGAIAPVDPGYGIPVGPGGSPPGIWGGGNVPMPTPPIYLPPAGPPPGIWPPPGVVSPPIYYPPGIWGPTDPRPSHPIVLPEPPEVPTEPPIAPPGGGLSDGWQWYYTDRFGWVLVWVPEGGGGKPQPPGGSASPPTPTPHK